MLAFAHPTILHPMPKANDREGRALNSGEGCYVEIYAAPGYVWYMLRVRLVRCFSVEMHFTTLEIRKKEIDTARFLFSVYSVDFTLLTSFTVVLLLQFNWKHVIVSIVLLFFFTPLPLTSIAVPSASLLLVRFRCLLSQFAREYMYI